MHYKLKFFSISNSTAVDNRCFCNFNYSSLYVVFAKKRQNVSDVVAEDEEEGAQKN